MLYAAMLLNFLNMTGDITAKDASQAIDLKWRKEGNRRFGWLREFEFNQVGLTMYNIANLLSSLNDDLPLNA